MSPPFPQSPRIGRRRRAAALAAACLLGGCVHVETGDDDGVRWSRVERSRKDDFVHVSLSSGGEALQVWAAGEIELSPEADAISQMGEGSRFKVRVRDGLKVRSLEVSPGPGGEPIYRFYSMGIRSKIDDDIERWIDRVLPEAIEESGLGAAERARNLLDEAGVGAVLQVATGLRTDYGRSIYFHVLLADPRGIARSHDVLEALSREIETPSYRAQLLVELIPSVQNGEVDEAEFLEAVSGLDGGYYQAELLHELVRDRDASGATLAGVLGSAHDLASDYYQAELLAAVGNHPGFTFELLDPYLELMRSCASDYYRWESLRALRQRSDLTDADLERLIRTAMELDGDYNRYVFLDEIAPERAVSEPLRDTYFAALANLETEFNRIQLLDEIAGVELDGVAAAAWLQAVGELHTDHYLMELLTGVAASLPSEEAILLAYLDAADNIDSEHNRARVLTALLERDDLGPTVLERAMETTKNGVGSAHLRGPLVETISDRLLL